MDFDSDAFNRTLFFPRPVASEPPEGATDHVVDVEGATSGLGAAGATLHLRIHRAAAATCTLLYFHGNGEVVADYDDAERFIAAGAQLAVVDYRGYGKSTGTPTLRNITTDAHAVLSATLTLVEGPIIVLGRSLGSACANELLGLGASLHARVVGAVLESGYTSLPRLAERRNGTAPDVVDAIFDPIAKLGRAARPILILHGARDTLIWADEAEAALRATRVDAKLLLIEGRGHNDIAMAPEYWSALASFIRRVTGA